MLGVCYQNGTGVQQSKKLALHYFELAAAKGYIEAQFNCGVYYASGTGLFSRDLERAVMWYNQSAQRG